MPTWVSGHGVDRRQLGVRFLLAPPVSLGSNRERALLGSAVRAAGSIPDGAGGLYVPGIR
jgi:hypothetical protein